MKEEILTYKFIHNTNLHTELHANKKSVSFIVHLNNAFRFIYYIYCMLVLLNFFMQPGS